MFKFWWSAGLVDGLKPHPPPLSSQRNEMLIFVLCSTSNDWLGWSMDSNPIHHPSPAKTVKCSFLYYIQHLMLARLVNGLEPHPPPLSSQKNEMLIFWLCSTSDDQLGWSMDLNPICQPSPANKMKCSFLDYFQLLMNFWWSAGLVDGLKPHSPPLSSQKNEMLIFGLRSFWWLAGLVDGLKPHPPPVSRQKNKMLIFWLCSTSDDWPDWSLDWNSLCHPSPAKNMKCYFLDYVQLLMIGWAGWWTQTPSTTPLQPKQWNAHFCITFNIWCWPDWSMDLNLIHHSSPAKKWNAHGLHSTSGD